MSERDEQDQWVERDEARIAREGKREGSDRGDRGSSLAGESFAADEREQTESRNRVARGEQLDEAGEPPVDDE